MTGPNGSGKSNVIDSLLFVFGFRASRIRLKKLKELIHNSSGKKQPEFCSVEVVFQKIVDKEHGDFEIVPGSEFTVGRTAYQDSTSKYTINGKSRSKDEIEKKLKDVGIDLVHNRFLILQGEVEQIALMKPKAEGPGKEGMLEYLEDIIGSSRLKNFLNDINLKLEEISTQKSQQNQKVKTAEKERNALEGPVRDEQNAMSAQSHGSKVEQLLGEAQRRGEITTYFGRLGDLGAIDAKYDAAVTTTTTGLNNYVLQTKQDGDRALEIIKQAKIGRHNLLVLDAISDYTNHMNAPREKFLAPRVFDLLEIPDPRLKKAFYNVFRDTMIVQDMEKARHLFNKHKARYITFTGGCIDASGIISGGGKPRTGGIGTTVKVDTAKQSRDLAREIEKLKADLDPKTRRVEELETKMRHNSQAIYKLADELQQLRVKSRQLATETQNLQGRVTSLEKQIAFQEAQVGKHQVDQALVDDKREKLDEMSAELEAAEKDLAKAQEVFKKASDNLDRVWMELCGRFREAADQAAKDIEKIDQNIADHQGKLKSFDRDKVKAEARLETAQKTYEDKLKLQESLKRDEALFDKEIGNLSEKRKEYEAKIQEADANLKAARKANSQQDEEEGKLNRERERKTDELKQLKEHMKGVEHEMAKTQKEILGLKLHRIKDYGILPQKVRQVADYDHHIDHETLEEEKAHQKKMKKQKGKENGDDDSSGTEDNSDGDDGAVPALTEEDLADADRDDLKFKLTQLQEKVRKNKEHLNMRIIADYAEKVKHYNQVNGVLQKLQENHAAHMKKQEEWKRVRMQEFMEGFTKIGSSLKEMYQMITLGGDAALDLKNSLDPFDEGISFMVRPPKKSWKNMENLSGGEKTLSSLSLVFALHHFRPTPLYVMDEIDAALDFRNVSIIGHYVKDRTKNAQFIIISLRNNMFELGDRLVGIYKTDDCTKNVVVDPAMVTDGSSRFKVALATVHQMDLERTLLNAPPTNAERQQEQQEDNVSSGASTVGVERGRKRVSHDSNAPVFFDSKRPDQRLSPTSDPDRRPRRPLRNASQEDDSN